MIFVAGVLLLGLVLFALMLGAAEVGRRIGAARLAGHADGLAKGGASAEAATFAPLGLLIALTFSGAASRFQERRDLVGTEANAILTAYLRLDLLQSDVQPPLRELFRRYTDVRIRRIDGVRHRGRRVSARRSHSRRFGRRDARESARGDGMSGGRAVTSGTLGRFSWAGVGSLLVTLSVALAGCSEGPAVLRIVSGPPEANEEVAALLVSASDEVAAPARMTQGGDVASADGALAALAAGTADLAIVENSAGFRYPTVRTVAPLYPSVLHIGVRPEKRGQTLAQVLEGARVFAGGEQTAGRQLLNRMATMYAWSGIEFSYVDSLDSEPDVVFAFAPVSPSAAPMLAGYELLSLGSAADIGVSSAADALALVAPFLRSFVIPEGTYGPLTPTPVATVAIDTLLVTRADTPIVAIYDLIQSLQMMGPLLVAQRPDLAIDELETFEISHVTFPVHAGTLALRARNDPGFAERASSLFEMAVTVVVALFTALFAFFRFVRGLRKGRIDRFYSAALEIRAKLSDERNTERRLAYVKELRALRADAFSLLIKEKLAADDSFRILQALIYDVIREAETPFTDLPRALDPAR